MDSSERVCHVDPLAAWATPSAACHCYDLLRLGLVSAWFLRVACMLTLRIAAHFFLRLIQTTAAPEVTMPLLPAATWAQVLALSTSTGWSGLKKQSR